MCHRVFPCWDPSVFSIESALIIQTVFIMRGVLLMLCGAYGACPRQKGNDPDFLNIVIVSHHSCRENRPPFSSGSNSRSLPAVMALLLAACHITPFDSTLGRASLTPRSLYLLRLRSVLPHDFCYHGSWPVVLS